MASFRTGFKIFGEISLKQGLGRIRSFSEDRKPGQWLPEDQWAVRQPGSTCPDCEKPKKPPKPSKSWLSICRDPAKEIECDVRHNNCPPPEVKDDAPWYSLDNFIPKKRPQEKTPALGSCKEELKRREMYGEVEEVCEKISDKSFPDKPEPTECCMPKKEPCPAPVVTLSCPLPKELDIMLWCERPCTDTSRIPPPCQSDRLPYDEFRPQKSWKPPPFSLPLKPDASTFLSARCRDSIPYAEFKQVDVPRPLYTRYKSVELGDENSMFCMMQVKCPDEGDKFLAITPPTPKTSQPACIPSVLQDNRKSEDCPEKPILEAASCKPVKIKKAPKYKFRPKPTKLIERTVKHTASGRSKVQSSDLQSREKSEESDTTPPKEEEWERPKVITGTLTDEPQTYEREPPKQISPPRWMYSICKPGSTKTPLVPSEEDLPKEPDNAQETDGLNFYDGKDESISPKPPPDPCLTKKPEPEPEAEPKPSPTEGQTSKKTPAQEPVPCFVFKDRFVLMPEEYNIKFRGCEEEPAPVDDDKLQSSSFEKFIEVKTASSQKSAKSYPTMKENILYDLQRLCPNPPLDPSKLNAPCRKPPKPECPQPPRFYRSFCTLHPTTQGKLQTFQLCKIQRRTECSEDSSGKCKVRKLVPRPRPCPDPPKKPECAQMTLPCCPKARIPPDCDVKKPLPICKKKLPPKPSFSECSKDPPPCPRITECDCWEKKAGKKGK